MIANRHIQLETYTDKFKYIRKNIMSKLIQDASIKEVLKLLQTFQGQENYEDHYFFKETGYEVVSNSIGEGSFGSVFSVKDDNNIKYAVKKMKIKDEYEFINEIRLTYIFSSQNIGPRLYKIVKINDIAYLVMEKLDIDLYDFFESDQYIDDIGDLEKIVFDLIKNSVHQGIYCADIKTENIMLKKISRDEIKADKYVLKHVKCRTMRCYWHYKVRLIDFGEFCCDENVKDSRTRKIIIDCIVIVFAFMCRSQFNLLFFKDKINDILNSKSRITKIADFMTSKTGSCSISDIYNNKQNTLSKQFSSQFSHYIVRRLIKNNNVYKLIKSTGWYNKIVISLVYILNGVQNNPSIASILPKKYLKKRKSSRKHRKKQRTIRRKKKLTIRK